MEWGGGRREKERYFSLFSAIYLLNDLSYRWCRKGVIVSPGWGGGNNARTEISNTLYNQGLMFYLFLIYLFIVSFIYFSHKR